MLDSDLAALYGVETKALNRAVKRNPERFPEDFMIRLTLEDFEALRCQSGTSNEGRGGRRYLPYAFTQEGVAMLSSVLQSPRAVAVNVGIMRAFIRLRQMALSVEELVRKVDNLENRYDEQFKIVFEAIRELLTPPEPTKRRIGFHADENEED
jgi:hypothetical protein